MPAVSGKIDERVPGFTRWISTPAGRVPVISSELGGADRVGAWKARWGIGRMSYLVPPGLYAIGDPDTESPVVVTTNYKMSYDIVRSELAGRNVWLLILETYGINVWCAAGKGTFSTGEVVRRVTASRLENVVSHRKLVLPLLGAPGVAAHGVKRRTGFSVNFSTIRASDLPAYLDRGMSATPEMRELTFTARERVILIPVELVMAARSSVPIMVVLFLLGGVGNGPFSVDSALFPVITYLLAVLAGSVLTPLLLPWLPGRSFAVKGWVLGLCWAAVVVSIAVFRGANLPVAAAAFLLLPAVSSFYALNFTGSTPFTSRSGVKKEMRIALPLMAVSIVVGVTLLLVGKFFN